MQTIEKFLSCDWGTSNFRLRLIEASTFSVLHEQRSNEGISATYQTWQTSGKDRWNFYLDIIQSNLAVLEEKTGTSLQNIPVVLSGMASSTIGMMELPYKQAPFYADGRDLVTNIIKATDDFKHDIIIISGATTGVDVMRGEETQMAGAFPEQKDMVIIFPGTHSKHSFIKDGMVTDIKTYMTGEFFELLSKKSILAASIEEGDGLDSNNNRQSFKKGIEISGSENILHSCFTVRTNSIFQKLTKQENFYYLSGLLIGNELRMLQSLNTTDILLVGNSDICLLYKTALEILAPQKENHTFKITDGALAVIKGQLRILCQLNYL